MSHSPAYNIYISAIEFLGEVARGDVTAPTAAAVTGEPAAAALLCDTVKLPIFCAYNASKIDLV